MEMLGRYIPNSNPMVILETIRQMLDDMEKKFSTFDLYKDRCKFEIGKSVYREILDYCKHDAGARVTLANYNLEFREMFDPIKKGYNYTINGIRIKLIDGIDFNKITFYYDDYQPYFNYSRTMKAIKEDGIMAKVELNSIYGTPKIKDVIFNDPATIVTWTDGTKTVVKAENEDYDPEKGLAMCIAKKALGNKGNYYDIFRKWLPKEEKENGEDCTN